MAKERVILDGTLEVKKGEGRDHLVSAIDIFLLTSGGRVTPGLYDIKIVRTGPLPKEN